MERYRLPRPYTNASTLRLLLLAILYLHALPDPHDIILLYEHIINNHVANILHAYCRYTLMCALDYSAWTLESTFVKFQKTPHQKLQWYIAA